MGLARYRQKRKFEETDEPEGKVKRGSKELIFVVQKHAASHLHYDFRIEVDGVLKSWAVPKGPSLNPADKRLAMMVEDHPYDYKDFEGTIPEGNYGAGNVIVWDHGTYHPAGEHEDREKALRYGLKKGHLALVLKGKKLKGEFDLVKMKGKDENAWLLIKKDDRFASDADVLKKNKSVISRKTLESFDKKKNAAPGKPGSAGAKKASSSRASGSEKKKPGIKPEKLRPMLAGITKEAFDDKGWVFEVKYDGFRTLAACDGSGSTELYSRNMLSFNERFAPVVESLRAIGHSCLLDGEVVVEDRKGRSGFQLLQNYQRTGKGTLRYYVFDLLSLDGNDTTSLPLTDRKKLLGMLISGLGHKHVIYSEHVEGEGRKFFEGAIAKQYEGMMAKRADSMYVPDTRTKEWLKIRINNEQEAVIGGFTEPRGSRLRFGSLLLGVFNEGRFEYIGNCGAGFTDALLEDLYRKFRPLITDESPFDTAVQVSGRVHWLEPKLVCQVRFTEWTGSGSMRHPVFLGMRVDKKASQVTREIPKDMKTQKEKKTGKRAKPEGKSAVRKTKKTEKKEASATSEESGIRIGQTTVKLTNQHKIYFPDDGITKGELVQYYARMADLMLPYLKDRPQSMHRFPNGITTPGFFQKDVDRNVTPLWVQTEMVHSESTGENIDYLLCNDKATLVYMANLGCIELNPWNSRLDHLSEPDWLVIDLDPEDISFREVVKAALAAKKVFDEMELPCCCKTSGATGLHVYVPLAAKYDYEVVKNFAHLTAQLIHELLPATTSLERMPSKRRKKVYVDFLQNRKGQTLAAPYSARPKPGATVSTPLKWSEVNGRLDPAQFTIRNIEKRVDRVGDLWEPVIGKGADLQVAIDRLKEKGELE